MSRSKSLLLTIRASVPRTVVCAVLLGAAACEAADTPRDDMPNEAGVSVDAAVSPVAMPDAALRDAAAHSPVLDAGSDGSTRAPSALDAASPTRDGAQSMQGASEAGTSGDASTAPIADAQTTADAAGTAPAACPASPSLAAGDHKQSLMHQGRSRTYLVHVPKALDGAKPAPLVLDFHGYSRTSSGQKGASGWDVLADREGVIVAYPDGVSSSWNVGGCCGTAGTSNVDDVGFARALVAKVATQLCVDPKRVYASGVSNGAGISARLGCDAADVFSGVALVSSDLRTQPCTPKRPVTEIAFRGTGDTLEPYEGGLVGPPGMQFQSPGARGSFELWKNINRCTGAPATTLKLCETYAQCAEGVEVTLCTLPGVGHSPYDNDLDFNIAQTTWDAFKRVPPR